jgi:uncharacterized membrane protein YdjX (TVP38/TMEM64 family)
MASSLVGFSLGRAFGGRLLEDLRSQSVERFAALVARNGFMASLVIRLVPFAPFVVVNMAAGMTTIALVDFAAGTGVGIAPKIALTAFAGRSALGGGLSSVVLLSMAAGVWLAAGLLARRWLRRPLD